MSMVLGIAALVGVSAITPGPNNVAVMGAAAHRGFAGALPAIAGVVLGTLIMLLVAVAGVGAALAAVPALGLLMSIAGCLYLCYLGGRMTTARATGGANPRVAPAGAPSDMLGLFVFQFLNPKGWAMVLTAVSAAQASGGSATIVAYLAAIFVIVPGACLALWSVSGALLSSQLRRPMFRLWFDRAMGGALIASALAMLVNAWSASGSALDGGLAL